MFIFKVKDLAWGVIVWNIPTTSWLWSWHRAVLFQLFIEISHSGIHQNLWKLEKPITRLSETDRSSVEWAPLIILKRHSPTLWSFSPPFNTKSTTLRSPQYDLICFPVQLFNCSQVCGEVTLQSAGFSALVFSGKFVSGKNELFHFLSPLSPMVACVTQLTTETWLATLQG